MDPDDDSLLSSTALPHVRRLQDEHAEWLCQRRDRFSQVLGALFEARYDGKFLVNQTDGELPPADELRGLAEEAAECYQSDLDQLGTRIAAAIESYSPLSLIAALQMGNVFGSADARYEPSSHSKEQILEAAVGLLMSMRLPYGVRTIKAKEHFELEAALREVERLQQMLLIAETVRSGDEDPELDLLLVSNRLAWSSIRGHSYEVHDEALTEYVYGPMSEDLHKAVGFDARSMVELFRALTDCIQERVNEAIQGVLSEAAPPADVQGLMCVADQILAQLGDAAAPTIDDIVRRGVDRGLEVGDVHALLTELSFDLEGDRLTRYRVFFDQSPLLERPLVRYQNRVLAPVPGLLVRDLHAHMEAPAARSIKNFGKRRAAALDHFAAELLVRALPGAVSYTNLFYVDETGCRVEMDGLVLFEDYAFVLEGKCSRITHQARRGDERRLLRDLGNAAVKAWEQGARDCAYIRGAECPQFEDERGRVVLKLDPGSKPRRLIVIAPTLHPLGHLSTAGSRLAALGVEPASEPTWTIFINDLQVIVEMLTTPAEFVHFVEWRLEVALGDRVSAVDELDLLGNYMFGGLHDLLDPGPAGRVLALANSTTDFDEYYFSIVDGEAAQRPVRVMGDFARRYVEDLCAGRPRAWLRRAFPALSLTLEEYAQIDGCLAGDLPDLAPGEVSTFDMMSVTVVLMGADVAMAHAILEHRPPDSSRVVVLARVDDAGGVRIVKVKERSRAREAFWSMPGQLLRDRGGAEPGVCP